MTFRQAVLAKYVELSHDDELFGQSWEPRSMKPVSGADLDNLIELVQRAVEMKPVRFADLFHAVNQDQDYTAVDLERALQSLARKKQVLWSGDVIKMKAKQ